jgi:hypothetical protein
VALLDDSGHERLDGQEDALDIDVEDVLEFVNCDFGGWLRRSKRRRTMVSFWPFAVLQRLSSRGEERGRRSTLFLYVVPALFTRISRRPNLVKAASTTDFQSSAFVTSALWKVKFDDSCATTFSPPTALMSETMTWAPSCAKRRAIAAPNPEPAPVG